MTASRRAYDSVDLIVWSGTGNTRHVAERVADAARSRDAKVRVFTTGAVAATPSAGHRLLGLLAPTHGFTAPWPIIRTALTLPGVRDADAFVLVTRGGTRVGGSTLAGFEGTAAYLPAAILALRGAHIRGAGAVDMPLNWTVAVPAAPPDAVAAIVAKGDAQTDRFSSRVLDGGTAFGGLAQMAIGLVMLPLSMGYMLIARLMLAKIFFADERCTSCGICERDCPQDAVHLRGKDRRPYWGFGCQNCMRCMSNCPTDAIQGGQAWLLLYILLIALPVGAMISTGLLTALGLWAASGSIIQLGFSYLWIVCSVWLAYALLWRGLTHPWWGPRLARATFTRGYRRYRGPDTPR